MRRYVDPDDRIHLRDRDGDGDLRGVEGGHRSLPEVGGVQACRGDARWGAGGSNGTLAPGRNKARDSRVDADVRRPVPTGTDRPREQGQPRARGRARRPVLYVDASPLVKLAKVEDYSTEARAFITGAARAISSEVVLTEVRRALYRTSASDPEFDLFFRLRKAELSLGLTELLPIQKATLRHAADF